MDEGNPELLQNGGVNFYKFKMTFDLVQEVLHAQQCPVCNFISFFKNRKKTNPNLVSPTER